MSNPVGIGLIGFGYWGPNLARNLHNLPGPTRSSCVPIPTSNASPMLELYPHLQTTLQMDELFQDPTLDAIVIATPARTHFEFARRALSCGKHVLVEKPLAMTSSEVCALAELAKAKSRVLMVGHTFEYSPVVWKLKDLIDAGTIGSIHYVYSQRLNLGRIQRDINALWSIAPHDISILLYLFGAMPVSVRAYGAAFLYENNQDVAFVTLNFPGNILAHIHVGWLDPAKVRRMTIVGTKKMIVYDDVDIEQPLRIHDKRASRQETGDQKEILFKPLSGDILIPKIDKSEPLRNECAHFVKCICENTVPTDAQNGLRVIQVLEAAQESMDSGGQVVTL